jgi:hypothetical protein
MSKFNVAPKASMIDKATALDGTEIIEVSQNAKGKSVTIDDLSVFVTPAPVTPVTYTEDTDLDGIEPPLLIIMATDPSSVDLTNFTPLNMVEYNITLIDDSETSSVQLAAGFTFDGTNNKATWGEEGDLLRFMLTKESSKVIALIFKSSTITLSAV